MKVIGSLITVRLFILKTERPLVISGLETLINENPEIFLMILLKQMKILPLQ